MLDIPTARALLARTRPAYRPDGYPPEVRAQVVPLARRLMAGGRAVTPVARALGLHPATLSSWLDGPETEGGAFVPVVVGPGPAAPTSGGEREHREAARVAARAEPPAVCQAPTTTLTVVTPSGYRLEGLNLEDAIAALVRLG